MRVDLLLVERGLVSSRERARALILAGRVLVREQKVDKPGAPVPADAPIRLLGEDQPYVSRGGLKLAEALAHWQIAVEGRACRADLPIASCSTARRMSPPSIPASARSP
jgi:23S rRNA (cytidine1920-2'-O)/16S rRNA (cytidine1409-2'-O)-methyltransferase